MSRQEPNVVAQWDTEEKMHYLIIGDDEFGPFTDGQMEELERVLRAHPI